MKDLHIGCVIMAAGNASRFGENKLAVLLDGKSMIRHALEAVPQELETVVVTQYAEVSILAEEFGFPCIPNEHPEWGISHTICLGTEHLPTVTAYCIWYQTNLCSAGSLWRSW